MFQAKRKGLNGQASGKGKGNGWRQGKSQKNKWAWGEKTLPHGPAGSRAVPKNTDTQNVNKREGGMRAGGGGARRRKQKKKNRFPAGFPHGPVGQKKNSLQRPQGHVH